MRGYHDTAASWIRGRHRANESSDACNAKIAVISETEGNSMVPFRVHFLMG